MNSSRRLIPSYLAAVALSAMILSSGQSYAQAILPGPHRVTGTLQVDGRLTTSGADGAFFFGTYGSGTLLPPAGGGTRMFFYPKKAAFRAGDTLLNEWDEASIGNYSMALGRATLASGESSTALGYQTTASGNYGSTALGYSSRAIGVYGATALCWFTEAEGSASFATGYSTKAKGGTSTAMGSITQATGGVSTALGGYTIAAGDFSTALGYFTTARGYMSTVLGRYNAIETVAPNAGQWVPTDPLFIIGNGDGVSTIPTVKNRNAVVVYKDGKTDLNGDVKVKGVIRTTVAAGDIQMFEQ